MCQESFLDKVRRHIGVRRLRHFVNRNLTLVKYTGMLVAKKGPFCWSSGSRRTNCLWIFLGQKKPNIKYQADEHLIMPESGVPRIPLNPNPLSEQIANSFGCDAGLRPIVLNGGWVCRHQGDPAAGSDTLQVDPGRSRRLILLQKLAFKQNRSVSHKSMCKGRSQATKNLFRSSWEYRSFVRTKNLNLHLKSYIASQDHVRPLIWYIS